MNNIIKAFTANGTLDGELWYTVLFDKIPSKYSLAVEDESKQLDPKQIQIEKCIHLFNTVSDYRYYIEDVEENINTEIIEYQDIVDIPIEESESGLVLRGEPAGSLYIVADNKIILIVASRCVIYYDPCKETTDNIKTLIKKLWDCFPKAEPEEKVARVGLIKYSNGEYYTSFSDIRKTTINIEENYNDDFIPVHGDILKFLNQRESGLILLYGKFGTGKTNYIRHLCSNVAKDYVIVPNSVASRLGDPDFVSYITSCKDYVFILEDCEQLLMDRTDNPWNNAITTILNMADGLLSDIVNIKFICTFNAAVDKVDKALLRKGRCFAKYEFKELCKEKVDRLNEKYNLGIKEIKPMTLAEAYNAEKRDYSEQEKPRKIGF